MLAAILNVEELISTAGYPLLFLVVMGESSGLPIPGETGADRRGCSGQPGQAGHRRGDRRCRRRGDRRRQHRLPDRSQGRTLAARAARRVPHPAPERPDRRGALLRAPRPQGGLLRPLPAGTPRLGVLARRSHQDALALIRDLERPRRNRLGDGHRAAGPTSWGTRPAMPYRPSASTVSSRSCWPS